MYNAPGRLAFSTFLAVLTWQLGLMGKLCFASLLFSCVMEGYISFFKHPQFGQYQVKLHYFETVTPRRK
jgi:hypothetical protein